MATWIGRVHSIKHDARSTNAPTKRLELDTATYISPIPYRALAYLPLLRRGPGPRFVLLDGMQHDLVGIIWAVARVALGPVVRHCIRENCPVPVERRRGNRSTNRGVALETVFGVLVPMKCQLEATWGMDGFSDQKWKVPSEPAVEKVPCVGWKESAFTLKTFVVEEVPTGFSRWHLKEKFMLRSSCQLAARHHSRPHHDTYPAFFSSTY